MKSIAWVLLLLLPYAFMFEQDEYQVIYERMEVVRYNLTLVDSIKTHNFKHNRTHAATNSTYIFKTAFGNELEMEIQAYRFASNEYRYFPIRFMQNYCGLAALKEFGLGETHVCGNFTDCPLKKGLYTVCNWAPNSKRFPPVIPGGSYMIDVKFYYRSVEAGFLQVYGTLKYPELPGFPIYRG